MSLKSFAQTKLNIIKNQTAHDKFEMCDLQAQVFISNQSANKLISTGLFVQNSNV